MSGVLEDGASTTRSGLMGEVVVKRRWFLITAFFCFATWAMAFPGFLLFRLLLALLTGEFGYSWKVIVIGLPLSLVAAAGWTVLPYTAITRFIRRNRPFLIVDKNGITIPDKGDRLIRWKDITDVGMTYGGRVTYLELQLTAEAQSKLTRIERFLTWGFSNGIIVATSAHGINLADNPFPAVKSYFDQVNSGATA